MFKIIKEELKTIFIIVLVIIATTKTINGYTYLYPLIPFDKKAFTALLYRRPLKCRYK